MTGRETDAVNLNRIDLNLLRVFEAVADERGVTRAGERLGLSQSAVSNALGRLRDVFGDELFVRTPGGMEPTALALELAGPVRAALDQVRTALALKVAFDPATARAEFPIGLSDEAEVVLAPPLVARLRVSAPGISPAFRHADRSQAIELLDAGAIQLALGVLPEAPSRMTRMILARDDFVCLMHARHPAAAGLLDLDAYLGWPHLLISATGARTGAVDRVLDAMGRRRHLAVVASHLAAAAPMLEGSDLLCTVPRRVGRVLAAGGALELRPVPLDLPPMRLSMLWHRRHDGQPAHAWLRRLVADLARAL
ncbi:MAG TPA: LysR family transcriptional regulator [Arenibaculum sp.]|nr:LysR family transcriptional regulator [Arenibaculum sp.]